MKRQLLVTTLVAARVSFLSFVTFELQGCASKVFVRPEGGGDTISYERTNEIISGKNVVVFSTNDSKIQIRYGVQIGSEYTSWINPLDGKPDSMLTSGIAKISIAHHFESALIAGLGGAGIGAGVGYLLGWFGQSIKPNGGNPSLYGSFVVESALIGGLSSVVLGLVIAPWDEYVFK